MPTLAYDQDEFEGRDDDVGLNVDTWNGGGGNNGDWTQDVDVNFRIRFVIQETGGGMANNATFTLFFNYDGAGYVEMTTTTLLQPAATSQYANGDTTTQLLGEGTYISGDSAGGVDDGEDTGACDVVAGEEHEVEFCLTIDGAQVVDEKTMLVRVEVSDGTDLDLYTNEPTITVNKAAPTTPIPDRFVNVTKQAVNRAAFY